MSSLQFKGVKMLMDNDSYLHGGYKFHHGDWTMNRNYGIISIKYRELLHPSDKRNFKIKAWLRLSDNNKIFDFDKKIKWNTF